MTIVGAPDATVTGVTVTAPGATVGAVLPDAGLYTAMLAPSITSGELAITASAIVDGTPITATAIAVVLPTVDAAWNQPIAVPGMVNTLGYEDGPVVSPDGEWLMVSSYSPVDEFCCTSGCRSAVGDATVCQTSLGPSSGPERPGMFGSDRIVDATHIKNQCPSLCLVGAGGTDYASTMPPPVSPCTCSHRQADGLVRRARRARLRR